MSAAMGVTWRVAPQNGGWMSMAVRRGRRPIAGVAIALAVAGAGAALAGTAEASGDERALEASLAMPTSLPPGGAGELTYRVRNVSDRATEGILVNVSLPGGVSTDLEADPHCQRTGSNDTGGALISCNFSDGWGQVAPGQTQLAKRGFHIAPDAPSNTLLGVVGVTAVPLEDGEPTEDWTDLDDANTTGVPISTSGPQ